MCGSLLTTLRCKNYAYLVTDDKTKEAVIIDPANPKEYGEATVEHDHLGLQTVEFYQRSRRRSMVA